MLQGKEENKYFSALVHFRERISMQTAAYTLENVDLLQTWGFFLCWNSMLPANHITVWDRKLINLVSWNPFYIQYVNMWLDPENVLGFESGDEKKKKQLMKLTVDENTCVLNKSVLLCVHTALIMGKREKRFSIIHQRYADAGAGFRVPFTCAPCWPAEGLVMLKTPQHRV